MILYACTVFMCMEAILDFFDETRKLERIELLAKYVCVDNSSADERQSALIWIAEMIRDIRVSVESQMKKPPVRGGLGSGNLRF